MRVAELARAMRPLGVETVVTVPRGPAVDYFAEKGLTCVPLSLARIRRDPLLTSSLSASARLLYDAQRLASLIRQQRVSVLHCNGVMNVVGPIAGRLAGVKVQWHMNDTLIPPRIYRAVLGTVGRLAHRIVYSSRAVAVHAGRPDCSPDHIMPPPVDVDRFAAPIDGSATRSLIEEIGLDSALPVVLTVGNVNRVKGHRYLLEATASLRQRGVPVQVVIVGDTVDSVLRRSLEETVRDAGMADMVRFVGKQSRVERYLHATTVFVLPSVSEAMPVALLEAMAAGLPCVATKVGGVPEVILDGLTGLLVPPGQAGALADAIEKYLRDSDIRRAHAKAAQEVVADVFSLPRIARHQAATYRALVEGE